MHCFLSFQPLMPVNMFHFLYESQSQCEMVSVVASISYHSICFEGSFQNAEVSCDWAVLRGGATGVFEVWFWCV